MDLSYYQSEAWKFAIYPNKYWNYEYPVLGLCGEAGEVANVVKKLRRDDLSLVDVRERVKAEASDTLWYLAAVCTAFNIDMNELAEYNLAKLTDRKARDVIGGSGDDR